MSIESELAEGLKKAGQDNIALPSSMPVDEQRDKAMENLAKPIAEAIEKGVRIEFKGSLTCAEIARLQDVTVGDIYMCSDEGKVGELECRNGTAVIWTEEGWRKFFEIDIESIGISREEVSSMIEAAVSVESTERANADTALGGRIDGEANARESADATLQGNIDAEASARESADDALDARIDGEETAREQADGELQAQIDAISSRSDVVDVVASHVELVAYDTSTLADNDVVKVLADETHDDAIAYYRWSATSEAWSFIGSQGPYYTISETDTLLAGKAPTNHASTATTYGVGDATHYGHVKVDSALSGASTNPVQNRVIKNELDTKNYIASKEYNSFLSYISYYQQLHVNTADFTNLILLADVTDFETSVIVNQSSEHTLFVGDIEMIRNGGAPSDKSATLVAHYGYTKGQVVLQTNNSSARPCVVKCDFDKWDPTWKAGTWSTVAIGSTTILNTSVSNRNYCEFSVTAGQQVYITTGIYSGTSNESAYMFVDNNNVVKGIAPGNSFNGLVTVPTGATKLYVQNAYQKNCQVGIKTDSPTYYLAIRFTSWSAGIIYFRGKFFTYRSTPSSTYRGRPFIMTVVAGGVSHSNNIPAAYSVIRDSSQLTNESTEAVRLSTPRNLKVNLASESAQSFDGSANAGSIGVANTLPITHGGTGATSARAAEYNILNQVEDIDTTLDDNRKIALCNQTKSSSNGVFRWIKLSNVWSWVLDKLNGLANWAASDLGATKYVPMSDSVSGDTKKASLNAIRTYVRDGMPTASDLNAVALVAHDELTLGLATKQDKLPLVSGTTDYDIDVSTARRSGYSWYTSNGDFYGLYLAETNFANASSTEQLTFEAFVTIDNSSDASSYTAGNLTMLVKVRGRGPDDIGCELKVLARNGFYGDSRVQPKLVVCHKASVTDYNFFIAIQFVDINTLQAVDMSNRNYIYVHPLSKFESCAINLDKAYGAIPYVAYETQPVDFSGVAYVLKDATNSGSPAGWAKAYFNGLPMYTTRFVYNQAGSEKLLIFAKGGDGYGTIVRIGYDSTAVQLLRVENGTWKSSDWEGIDAHTIDGHLISVGTYSSVPGAISFV